MERGVMTERQMRATSDSTERLHEKAEDPYKKLAGAIVCTAVDDYRLALRENNKDLLDSLDEFFHSDWYKTLCNLSPEKLLADIRREHMLSQPRIA